MVRFSFKPKRCTARDVQELVAFINEQNLQQTADLRKAFEQVNREIEQIKRSEQK